MKIPVKIPGYDKWRIGGPPDPDDLTDDERADLDEEADGLGDYLLERDWEDRQP